MTAPPATDPLTPQQREEIALAKERSKAIHRAAGVANFNGWVTAVIAALSVPFAPFSVVGFLVTVGLAVIAYNEFRGRNRLLAFDPSAATLLGWNQVGLLSLITAYCFWMMFAGIGTFTEEFQRQLDAVQQSQAELGNPPISTAGLESLVGYIVVGFYGTVIVLSIVFQGLNALYYFTRRKYVEAYLQQTPEWAREIVR
jgi:hypothetical protein